MINFKLLMHMQSYAYVIIHIKPLFTSINVV